MVREAISRINFGIDHKLHESNGLCKAVADFEDDHKFSLIAPFPNLNWEMDIGLTKAQISEVSRTSPSTSVDRMPCLPSQSSRWCSAALRLVAAVEPGARTYRPRHDGRVCEGRSETSDGDGSFPAQDLESAGAEQGSLGDRSRPRRTLAEDFGIKRLLFEGDGGINGTFLAAGLFDQISPPSFRLPMAVLVCRRHLIERLGKRKGCACDRSCSSNAIC
jgi:hypothetical protein